MFPLLPLVHSPSASNYTPCSLWPHGVQPSESDHSGNSANSRVVIPNMRTCFLTLSSPRTINKQATTVG